MSGPAGRRQQSDACIPVRITYKGISQLQAISEHPSLSRHEVTVQTSFCLHLQIPTPFFALLLMKAWASRSFREPSASGRVRHPHCANPFPNYPVDYFVQNLKRNLILLLIIFWRGKQYKPSSETRRFSDPSSSITANSSTNHATLEFGDDG